MGWWALTVAVALVVGVVCGRWAFAPPAVERQSDAPATVAVSDVTVGTSVPMAVSAAWTSTDFGIGAAAGTVTTLDVADGSVVDVGSRLYSVDLRPVVAAVGQVPAFRDLSEGSSGQDVAQLQQLLVSTGFMTGTPDGRFQAGTTRAVRAWQKASGVAVDGVVRAGDLVYAAGLPARVRWVDGVEVGRRIGAGEAVLSVLVGEPEFVATVPSSQDVDTTLPIEVTFDEQVVSTTVSGVREDTSGNSILVLTRPDGSSVCADRCDLVPLNPREAVYPARQVIVPAVTGPGVPAAALWFTAAGEPYLVQPDGSTLEVTILGRGQGLVVLDGVAAGTTVVLADQTTEAGSSTASTNPAGGS